MTIIDLPLSIGCKKIGGKLFKLFHLCSVHVIKLKFFTTTQICGFTFVALPL